MKFKITRNIITLSSILVLSNYITYFLSNKHGKRKIRQAQSQAQAQALQIYTKFNPDFLIPLNLKRAEIIVIMNPIDSSTPMLWLDNTFTRNNWPDPPFQKHQKKEALKYILEKGKGVIDCGAHIGDFGVCLAVMLKALKRSDIIVYCIDPSKEKCDFMTNAIDRTFPYGTEVEIFSFESLEKSWKIAKKPSEREHVTPFMCDPKNGFKLINIKLKENYSHFRYTVDRIEDLQLVKKIIKNIVERPILMKNIINLYKKNPELFEINKHIEHDGHLSALKKDEEYFKCNKDNKKSIV